MLALRYSLFIIVVCMLDKVVFALGVSPTLLELSPQLPIASLMVSNDDDIPQTMQIEAVRWQQHQGQDEYTPNDDLIVTPQIFIIPPHSTQLVRVGLENQVYKSQEQAYRLLIQEVIPKIKTTNHGLRMALRISLPVIIKSHMPIQQLLSWQINRSDDNVLTLTAWNRGNNVLFIDSIQVFSAASEPVTSSQKTFVYLLPGSKKKWTIKKENARLPKIIKTTINHEVVFANVV